MPLVDVTCAVCQAPYQVRAVILRYGRGRYCSRACVNRALFSGKTQSAELIAKRTSALKGRRPSDRALEAAAQTNRARTITDAEKTKRLASLRATLADPIKGPRLRELKAALRRGYVHSPETKAAIRAAHRTPAARARASSNGKRWRSGLTPEQRTDYFRKLLKHKSNTRIEQSVAATLSAMSVHYEPQYPIDRYSADFYVPAVRLVIECDGEWWHRSEAAQARDAKRDQFMRQRGYSILRLPEKVIRSGGAEAAIRSALAECTPYPKQLEP